MCERLFNRTLGPVQLRNALAGVLLSEASIGKYLDSTSKARSWSHKQRSPPRWPLVFGTEAADWCPERTLTHPQLRMPRRGPSRDVIKEFDGQLSAVMKPQSVLP